MRSARVLAMVATLSVAALLTGCLSGNGKTPNGGGGNGGGGNASLQSISLQPQGPTVAPGDSKQFTAMGHYSDGSTKNITSSCSWSSSDKSIATVDATTGLAQAIASGSSTITATSSGITNSTKLTVSKLANVTVAPGNATINPTQTQQFTATAHYADGEAKDVTTKATWTSSDTSIATVGPNTGLATGVKAGKVTIAADYQGNHVIASLTVLGVTSISVTPIGPAVVTSGTQQFTATANFSDGSHKDVTSSSTWASSTTSATINNSGLATATSTVGQTEISATYQNTFTDQTAMDVTASPAPFTNADVNGSYAISLISVSANGTTFLVGTLNADGAGKISSGTVDINGGSSPIPSQSVTGTYTVFPDGRGDLTFGNGTVGGPSHTVRFVLTSNKTTIQVIEFDALVVSQGQMELESGPFNLGSLSGTYTFAEGGFVPTSGTAPYSAVGIFTSDGSGNITSGEEDVNNNGLVTNFQTFKASVYSQPDSSIGRYLVNLNNGSNVNGSNFVFYLVSPTKAYFISTDPSPSPVVAGFAESQTATTIANGNFVFLLDASGTPGKFQIAGQIGLNAGTVTGGEQDEVPVSSTAKPITGGSYTAFGLGRYSLCENIITNCDRNFIAYTVSGSRFFMLRTETDKLAAHVAMGAADMQSAITVAANTTFGLRAAVMGTSSTNRTDLGLIYNTVPAEACSTSICGIGDRNNALVTSSISFVPGSLGSIDGSGRGTMSLPEEPTNTMTYIFYVVSGNKLVVIGETPNTDGYMNLQ